jgi:hypothetical protein
MRRVIIASLLLTYLTACTIYFTGDDEPCEGEPTAPIRLIDPTNLTCVDFSSPSGCGPVTLDDSQEDGLIAIPTWGYCDSACSGLDVVACAGTAGCRAAHDWACYTGDGPCYLEDSYLGCFPIDTTGPITGTCEGNDAYWCSMHDNCFALHDNRDGNTFVSCVPEWDF